MLTLQIIANDAMVIEAEGFLPEGFSTADADAVKRAKLWCDNSQVEAGELFAIEGDPADGRWRFEGDLSRVHRLGERMAGGEIAVEGAVGRHAGAMMCGGRLTVRGDAADWLGAEMRGGEIEAAGSAGDFLGAAYRASPRGMRGGRIVVRGSAGKEAGHTMRRGLIVIGSDCGELAGYRMRAGTLAVFGHCGDRPGAEMVRGTVALFGGHTALLPTFASACLAEPQVLGLLAAELGALGYESPRRIELFNGDLLHGGRGELLLPA